MRKIIKSANGAVTYGGKVLCKMDDTLPSGYTSIQAVSLNSLFDTGVKTKDTSVIEARVNVGSTTATYLWRSDSNTSGRTNTTAYSSSGGNWRFGNQTFTISNSTFARAFHDFKQDRSGVWRDGTKVNSYGTVPAFTSSANLQFGSSTASVSNAFSYFKHTIDGVVISWYIACRRDSDNAEGFYDIVKDIFIEI